MKKIFLTLLLGMVIVMTSCSGFQQEATKAPELSGIYKTLLSKNNESSIVRHPPETDLSLMHPGRLTQLPSYDPDSNEMWQVDLRSADLSSLNLDGRLTDLMNSDFDSKTKWPSMLPEGFDPKKMMELGKNPGLGLRKLHKEGITGKGVGLAIIDQCLLVDHSEYKDQLKLYEEIHNLDESAAMHGPAVASIAVGKTVGVAPGADLYYIAETHGVFKGQGKFDFDLSWLAKSIDRIVEINRKLPKDKKIRVISISLGIDSGLNGSEKALKSIEKAKKQGIYTVYVGSDFWGLGREPLADPDNINSYKIGELYKNSYTDSKQIWVPMDSRCTASPTGINDYVFYRQGGASWTVPYIAGLYALACQVKPDITPEAFWKAVSISSSNFYVDRVKAGLIINPAKLIESIR